MKTATTVMTIHPTPIRPSFSRPSLACLFLACLTALATSAAAQGGTPPGRPDGLRFEVYSRTAAELFWERSVDSDGFVRGYEIRRDGELVRTVDGPSFFTDALEPGVVGEFTVVAIDDEGLRSPAVGVFVDTGRAPGDPGGAGDRPPSPANLRSARYSTSAGELFWDRVTGRRLSYEVSLDGAVVAMTDGTSHFTGSVGAIDGTRAEVVAIGPDGARSVAARTTFGEEGSSPDPQLDPPPDPRPDPPPGTDAPPAPANPQVEVYSRFAAELFWDRAPAGADVVGTEVVRDGTTLGTTRGTSFFDDTRVDGVDHAYELVAVDSRGERSAPTVIDDEPVTDGLDLLDVGQELVRTLAGYPLDRLAVVVDDLAFTVGQTTTIAWPDDDYYQVQNARTFAEVCNGGAECPVVPGSYVVINQTTGERSPLEVAYVAPADRADAVPLPASSFEFGADTIPVDRTLHECEDGGSVTVAVGTATLELDDFRIRGDVERRGYRFDECRITVRDGLLPDGGYVVRGSLETVSIDPFDRFSYADDYRYDDFSIVGDDGLEYRVDGRVALSYRDGSVQTARRSAAIDVYAKTSPDGRTAESVTGGRFERETVSESGPSLYRETLDADGTVRGTLSADRSVVITTEPVLTRQLVPPFDGAGDPVAVPFTGTVELLAEDGSFLYVSANPITDPAVYFSPALVDLDHTRTTGRQVELNQAELIRLDVSAPNCGDAFGERSAILLRDERTGRLACSNGAAPVVP